MTRASKARVRVVVNNAKVKELRQRNEQAMAAIGQEVLEIARVPDAPPYGSGLIETGSYAVIRDGSRVAGNAERPRQVSEEGGGHGCDLVVGYGFPGRFLEFGTIKMSPHPFLTPAYHEAIGHKADTFRKAHR